MLKGNMGIRIASGLMIGVILLGVVGFALSDGPLGSSISQSIGYAEQATNVNTELDASQEDEAKETLSDLAMFVRDRSVGCEQVENRNSGEEIPPSATEDNDEDSDDPRVLEGSWDEGYPGLEDTLGQNPRCIGGEATVARDPSLALPGRGLLRGGPEDNLMAGNLGRETFEVTGDPETDSITFRDDREQDESGESDYAQNDYWLENNIAGVSSQLFSEHINPSAQSHAGSGRNFVIFFEDPEVGEERTNLLLSDEGLYPDRVWDASGGDALWPAEGAGAGKEYNGIPYKYFGHAVTFCPGDEGYVQINRDTPDHTGLPEEDGNDGNNYYPMLVVEESEVERCGEEFGEILPYQGLYEANTLQIENYDLPEFKSFELADRNTRCQAEYIDGDSEIEVEYGRGQIIQQDHSSFSREHLHPRGGDDGSLNFMDDIEFIGNDEFPSSGAGELMQQTQNIGYDELYGDLLCTGDGWKLCHEDTEGDEVEVGNHNHEFACNSLGYWTGSSEEILMDYSRITDGVTEGSSHLTYPGESQGEEEPEEIRWSGLRGWDTVEVDIELTTTIADEPHITYVTTRGDAWNPPQGPGIVFITDGEENQILYIEDGETEEVLAENFDWGEVYTLRFDTDSVTVIDENGAQHGRVSGDLNLEDFRPLNILEAEGSPRIRSFIRRVEVEPLERDTGY